ncbi:MAG: efflux RND transporter permease subunit [Dethiobacteria bacterium]
MNLSKISVMRPVATVTILLIVLVIGTVSLLQTPLDLLPDIKPPYLAVITVFPGSSPQENLKLVTEPIESAVSPVSGVKNIISLSQEHVSLVALEFNWGANLKQKRDEVGTRLALVTLPEGVEHPTILEFDPTLLPIMQVDVSSSLDPAELTEWLEKSARPRLEAIPGVASMMVEGGVKRDLFIRLFPNSVQEYELSYEQVANILRASLLNLPGGKVVLDDRQMRIRLVGRSPDLEEIRSLVVGFQLDEEELKKLIGRSVDIDLNRMLSQTLPSGDSMEIPMREIYLKDLTPRMEIDEEGRLTIEPDPELLKKYGINLEQVARELPENWPVAIEKGKIIVDLPPDVSAELEEIGNTHLVNIPDFEAWKEQLKGLESKIKGELNRASQQLEKAIVDMSMAMILSSAGAGGGPAIPEDEFPLIPIRLQDIAEVNLDLHEASSISRINRHPSIGFYLQKEGESNTVAVSRQVHRALDELAAEFNELGYDLSFKYTFDQAKEIETALMDLAVSLLLGSLLAVAVLLLFLRDWRMILVIGLTIPVAVLSAFALLYFSGLSINLMTLGALALAAGMLVDNSIVVSENIYRHLQLGSTSFEAAIKGSNEVAGAIWASTLTTVCVFFPVVFLSGLAGELFRDFSLTVTCALFASLIVAMTVIPMLTSRILQRRGKNKLQAEKGPSRYRTLLEWVLRHPWATLGIGVAAVLLGAIIIPFLDSDLFPIPEESAFSVELTLPPGTPLETTDGYTVELEKIVGELEGVDYYTAQVGEQQLFGIAIESGVPNRAKIRAQVLPDHTSEIDQMIERIKGKAEAFLPAEAALSFRRETIMDTTGLSMGLELIIQGPEQEKVAQLSEEIMERIKGLPGLTGVQSATEEAIPEVHVKVDQFKALRKGTTAYQVGMMLYEALDGVSVARLETGEGIFELILSYRKGDLKSLEDLEKLGFYTSTGSYLRLGDIANIEVSYGPLNIARENQQVIGRIQAQLSGISLSEANRAIQEAIKDLDLPPGYQIQETTTGLMAEVYDELYLVLIVSVFLVYLVMAAQFESFLHPFIIICSLPLALSGSVIALMITGRGLSIPALIGSIVLVGILVNSGIIMVDFINQLRRIHGKPLEEAIITGASTRLRPILMTTLTTILGLVPLSLGLGQGSQVQAPMAIALIGGMTSGTVLLLGFIPALYYLINRKKGIKVDAGQFEDMTV